MINIAVEGESDREMAKAVVRASGGMPNIVRSAGGHTRLDPLIPKYHDASRGTPWVVFRDSDAHCPVRLREDLLQGIPEISPRFSLRIAKSMAEAWLLSDRSGFAEYFRVSEALVPSSPEDLPHAKRTLLQIVNRSRSRVIRSDMVAANGEVGPLYVSRINEFASQHWNVESAAENADSLRRALSRVRELVTI